jgi:hypothetical protein
MNDIYILYDERDQIGTKPPDAELCVVGKTFWTPCHVEIETKQALKSSVD